MIALVGDGAMQMNGINELITIAKYWKQWSDPRLIVLVLNNRDLNQVTWEQRVMAGDPKFEASQDLPDFPYARYAERSACAASASTTPEQVGAGVGRGARAPTGPVVLEARHRSGRAAAAAAHHARAGEGLRRARWSRATPTRGA